MMSGPAGSGKSTIARELLKKHSNMIRVNRDDIRLMALDHWTASREGYIIEAEIAVVKTAMDSKLSVVVDDTNLTDRDLFRWKSLAESKEYEFEKRLVSTKIEECIERDANRTGKAHVGRSIIERQFIKGKLWDIPQRPCPNCTGAYYIGAKESELCTVCKGKGTVNKLTCIFDIDGTLADLEHRIPWITVGAECPACKAFKTRCGLCTMCDGTKKVVKKSHSTFYLLTEHDKPIDIVTQWIQACYEDFHVLIVSGRSPEDTTEDLTAYWLQNNGVKYHHMLMRRAYNHGPDTVEKQLILNEILTIIPKEEIAFVVDDRPSVVKMWRDNGLRVIPVRGRDDDVFYKEI